MVINIINNTPIYYYDVMEPFAIISIPDSIVSPALVLDDVKAHVHVIVVFHTSHAAIRYG